MIRTHNLSNRAAANPHIRPRGYWDWPGKIIVLLIFALTFLDPKWKKLFCVKYEQAFPEWNVLLLMSCLNTWTSCLILSVLSWRDVNLGLNLVFPVFPSRSVFLPAAKKTSVLLYIVTIFLSKIFIISLDQKLKCAIQRQTPLLPWTFLIAQAKSGVLSNLRCAATSAKFGPHAGNRKLIHVMKNK